MKLPRENAPELYGLCSEFYKSDICLSSNDNYKIRVQHDGVVFTLFRSCTVGTDLSFGLASKFL